MQPAYCIACMKDYRGVRPNIWNGGHKWIPVSIDDFRELLSAFGYFTSRIMWEARFSLLKSSNLFKPLVQWKSVDVVVSPLVEKRSIHKKR